MSNQHSGRTQQDYDDVRNLHAQGLGRNEIAEATGRSGHLVSLLAAEMGLSFARAPEVAAAMEARRDRLAERRLALAEALQADAENLREQMWQPTLYFDWGGKDHDYDERLQDEPTPADKRALLGAAGMAIDRSLKLVPASGGTGAEEALSMLGSLAAGFARIEQEEAAAEEG